MRRVAWIMYMILAKCVFLKIKIRTWYHFCFDFSDKAKLHYTTCIHSGAHKQGFDSAVFLTLDSNHIRKIAPGMPGTFSPPLVSEPGIHQGTCITNVPWCMSGSLTHGGGENVPGIPGACATPNYAHLVRGPWDDVVTWKHFNRYWPFMRGIHRSPGVSLIKAR